MPRVTPPEEGQSVSGTPYFQRARQMKHQMLRAGPGSVAVHNYGHTRGIEWCPDEAEAKIYRTRPYSIKDDNYPQKQ